MKKRILECVPNFSEGIDRNKIKQITDEIRNTSGVKLLNVDPGKATNRTVVTFVGEPEAVIEAAFLSIKKAAEVIDMSTHSGEHPRMGATDVCPLIPISGIEMKEVAEYAHTLAERVGKELGISIYMYEEAATEDKRRNLASVRAGEYEGMADKLLSREWKPDYGPDTLNEKAGVTAIGARDFLIAYNINLNTTSTRRANSVAFDVREVGRVKREGGKLTGKVLRDENGEALREPGTLKSVKAIGWYIEEYEIAQISMNLTDIHETPLHIAFEEVRKSAQKRGLRVTGSELVGLVPKKVMLEAGKHFLRSQNRSIGVPEEEIIRIAVLSLGLDELSEFDPKKRIIEYMLEEDDDTSLGKLTLTEFAHETASESVAPGGGSVSAYASAMGSALGTMVASLSAHKRGWDDQVEYFSDWGIKGQDIIERLMKLVDEDTEAFNQILKAFRMPKSDEEEKEIRKKAIQDATKYATKIPYTVMETSYEAFDLIEAMVEKGNPNSITDAGVGALCITAGIEGAYMNVCVNAVDIKDKDFSKKILSSGEKLVESAKERRDLIQKKVFERLGV